MKQFFRTVLTVLFLVVVLRPPEIAAKGITVTPSFQEIEIEQGVPEASASFTLRNDHETAVEFELFAYDFQQRDHFGSLALLDGFETAYAHTLASFLRFTEDRLVLPPGESKDIIVTIQNRDSLSPGGHYAAVIIRQVQHEDEIREVLPALSTLLLIRKKGAEQFHLSINSVDWKRSSVRFFIPDTVPVLFQNDGNTHVVPRGNLEIKDIRGRVVYQGTINQDSVFVLPGTERRIPIQVRQSRWTAPVMVMSMTIRGTSSPGGIKYHHEDSFLYIHPGALVAIIVCSALLVYMTIKRRKKRT